MKKQILFLVSGIIIGALLVGVYFGVIRKLEKEPPHKDIFIGSRYGKLAESNNTKAAKNGIISAYFSLLSL